MELAVAAKTGVEFDVANGCSFVVISVEPDAQKEAAMLARLGQRRSNGPSWAHWPAPSSVTTGMMVRI